MVFWFILFIMLLLLAGAFVILVLPILFNENDVKYVARDNIQCATIIACMFCFFGGMVLHIVIKADEPTASDVYQGKTEIQVDYHIRNNDTIDIDTTIVFKNR